MKDLNDAPPPRAEIIRHELSAIEESPLIKNHPVDTEEMYKLFLLLSNPRPFVHQTPEPESRKMIPGLTMELPPPAVYRRKKNTNLRGPTKE